MTNPPDFVMYVVMVKTSRTKKFDPDWCSSYYAIGFKTKKDARIACRSARVRYGKKNAYVQQYGPYK